MSRTRRTEQRTLQDLGLIRDERDRELERAARGRSCSVLVTVSLLMAAACLLQGDSAWAPLLALTPLSWAVQHFSRFAADGKRLYLVLALLSGAAALALLGWYLIQGQEGGLFSIGRLIGFAVLSCLLISLAGLVFLALFLAFLFVKGRWSRMNEEKWERYFQSISTLGLLVRLGGLLSLAMVLVSILSVPLFQLLGFPAPERLALVLLAAGLTYTLGKLNRDREKLLRNLDKEIPHGTAVEVTRFSERDNGIIDLDVTIYCEKASHKGIIIGKNGEMLKKISSHARQDIEKFMGTKVYMETWVKVKENWRDNVNFIRDVGYRED